MSYKNQELFCRLSKKRKAYWMTNRHGGSHVSEIRRVFDEPRREKSNTSKSTKSKVNQGGWRRKSSRKTLNSKTVLNSDLAKDLICNESTEGKVKDFNNNSEKVRITKQTRRRKSKSKADHSMRTKSTSRESKSVFAEKSKRSKKDIQILPDRPLQEMKLSCNKRTTTSNRMSSKKKNVLSSSSGEVKKADRKKRKRVISAKGKQAKSITDSKKFKENFGKSNRKNIKANVKLYLKKFCAKRPPGTPIDENIPIDRLENKSQKVKKRKCKSKVKTSKKRRSALDNTCNKQTNNNNNSNSNLIHEVVSAPNSNAVLCGFETCQHCSNLFFPKYFRGREPRYPHGSAARKLFFNS